MGTEPDTITGLVLRIDAKICHVDVGGRTLKVPLRGRLFERRGRAKQPIAVGDRVRLAPEGDAVQEVLPRTSQLARRASGEDTREQVIAANITRVIAVAAIDEPAFQPDLVDSILASAERQEVPAVLVLTKLDRDERGEAQRWIDLYRGLGYEVLATSLAQGTVTTDSLDRLATLLHENVSVLTGASGVGKSTLINHLVPGLDLRIGDLTRARLGKHTTSHTRLIPLPGGGHILDTPGIRNFGLWGAGQQELTFYFREMAAIVHDCAFRNCTHRSEPGCAIRSAVDRGAIAPTRYASYLALLEELA